jgi:hypothetical protein
MPLDEGFYGTDAEGNYTKEYCRFCFQKGEFTEPELTSEQMVQRTIDFMTRKLKLPEAKAREFSSTVIPKLKRWNPSEF